MTSTPHQKPRGLSVRSAVLSVLLGAHPQVIPSSQLVAAAQHFDMTESSVRVALTRAVTAGDLRRTAQGYGLGERLLRRYERQAEAVAAHPTPWDGAWETAIIVASGPRPGSERAALRSMLADHRLAELREGVWLRPKNLTRPATYADQLDLRYCESRHHDPRDLAAQLWDLTTWNEHGRELLEELSRNERPTDRLVVAAQLVRHLSTDPILPPALVPADWVGDELRATYADYEQELRNLVSVPD